jgi:tripartite motif-containing protein 71
LLRGLVVAALLGVAMAFADVAPAVGADYQWLRTVDHYGSDGSKTFNYAESVTVDPSGNVWATDGYLHGNLVKFDGNGNYLDTYGHSAIGIIADGLHSTSAGNIWVAANHCVVEFDGNGGVLKTFSSQDYYQYGADVIYGPSDVAADPSGNVWVTDWTSSNFGLYKFDGNGTLLGRFGPTGGGPGQLRSPYGLAIDASGNVWVSDSNRILQFNSNGSFIKQIGTGYLTSTEGMTFDAAGNLWATNGNRIDEFSTDGTHLSEFVSPATGPGQFSDAQGIAFDAVGDIWLADTYNHRLLEFSPVPEPSTLVLLGMGAVSVFCYAWRRWAKA